MKEIKILTNIMCVLLALCACTSCSADTTDKETDGNETTTQDTVNTGVETDKANNGEVQNGDKRVIYYDLTDGGSQMSFDYFASDKVEFEAIDSRFSKKGTEIKKDSKLSTKKSITLGQKTYTLDYNQSVDDVFLGRNYDEYTDSKKRKFIEISDKGDTVAFFTDMDLYGLDDGTETEEAAHAKADALLLELYGEEAKMKYQYNGTIPGGDPGDTDYHFYYSVYAWGYRTSDYILITIDTNGNCTAIKTPMFAAAYNAEQLFSKEDVEAAMAATEAAVPEGWDKVFYEIKIDTLGKYYVEYIIDPPHTEETDFHDLMMIYSEIISEAS